MHTDAERKYAAKAARVRRASREDGSSLLDCTRRWKGSMQDGNAGEVCEKLYRGRTFIGGSATIYQKESFGGHERIL